VLLALAHAIAGEGIRRILELEDDLSVVGNAADVRDAFRAVEELQPDLLVFDTELLAGDAASFQNARLALRNVLVLWLNVDGAPLEPGSVGVAAALPRSASSADLLAAVRATAASHAHAAAQVPSTRRETPTARELQVLRLVQQGLKNRAIAQRLQTTERTVQFHLTNVYAKLSAGSRTEAVHLARQYGWFD
jgi:DNA-binding NarL/FixJ family response regulator